MYRNTTNYKIAGTKFFRAASSATVDDRGTNLQNIEKYARRIYKADAGKILIQCDQAGAEALIVAYLCKPGNYRDLFLHKVKPHSFMALHLFADKWRERTSKVFVDNAIKATIPELNNVDGWNLLHALIKDSDNWPAQERYYFIAKMVIHGSSYDMRGPTFQMNVLEKSEGKIVLSLKQANDLLMGFHSRFPEIKAWHRETETIAKKSNTLYNLQGYPIEFATINESMFKELYASVPQSTVGCITHIALTNLQNFIEMNNRQWDILANTHDSYLVQCDDKKDEIEECSEKMTEFMNQKLTSPRGEIFAMKSEVNAGFNWAPYHKDKNTQGMGCYKFI